MIGGSLVPTMFQEDHDTTKPTAAVPRFRWKLLDHIASFIVNAQKIQQHSRRVESKDDLDDVANV